MESFGVFFDGEWNSDCRNLSSELYEFTQQIPHQFSSPLEHEKGPSFLTPFPEANMSFSPVNENLLYPLNATESNLRYKTLERSPCTDFSTGAFVAAAFQEVYCLSGSNHFPVGNSVDMSMDFYLDMSGVADENRTGPLLPAFPNFVTKGTSCIGIGDSSTDRPENFNARQLAANAVPAIKEFEVKRKLDVLQSRSGNRINISSFKTSKKKSRVSKDARGENAQEDHKRNVQSKGNGFNPNGKDGESNIGLNGQSSSSYNSEDENASPETNGGAMSDPKTIPAFNASGKTKASSGSATDPQSLYARKRRERINERLRILQNLVPNGTKVDISTMLEEAINYVKFLQLQIKLLSSDDLWMYAPLDYNGIDLGLNKKLSALL